MINPLYLRTFMKLASTHHFTRTAELLHMTQPGVSQHIRKLEAQLGKPLLARYGKSFELTPAGETLYRFGLEQVEAEAELMARLAEDESNRGECRLACSGSMAMQLYPRLLALQGQYPGLRFALEAAPNAVIVERVKLNQTDIGLVTQPVKDPKLLQQPLGEDSLCLVVPRGGGWGWEALMELGFINHPDGHHYASELLELNYPDHFNGMEKIPHSGYINQLGQILLPVARGLGFTVLPQSTVEAFADTGAIHSVALPRPVRERVYCLTKKHRRLPVRYQLITRLLEQQWPPGDQ
ncbi:LysR family transcriptional regulator [Aestuariirhabdus litorea]|uniref:LysR family transcriptional regulator n=1 Tax=Aestuariirhabdus litorea TaxID=2528527 RepID=A0A3P3VM17_9GAMM|nr:LysR family transcriptional regulator [Aestuariirhabdus litorea]RRJ82759.1 LysR family transcriptional regulator [Aestuariirhabdus litorea]RWW92920.1 LysR family transcriptional regulator [Endozoicomonadaceae bacterium GTF-13]